MHAAMAVHNTVLVAFLCVIVFTEESLAALNITQGRLISTPRTNVEPIPVVGIATVEIGGDQQITYYFDCTTDLNNGSGLRWARENGLNRFSIVPIPSELPGQRLRAAGIRHSDLDVYTCWDRYSDDVNSIIITDSNPAIMATQENLGVVQGSSAVLEVYVSGYPVPDHSHITWRRPEGYVVTKSDEGVEFQGHRRLVLSNLQPQQAGVYMCEVVLSHIPYRGASTRIDLDIYVPSTFLTHPQDVLDAVEWSSVILTCSASGNPSPSIRWEREGGTQLPVGVQSSLTSVNETTNTGQLTFSMVRYDDRGRYRCVADNSKTNVTLSEYAAITVSPKLRFTDDTGQPIADLHFVEDQSRVQLECFGTGNLQWSSSTGLQISSNWSDNIYWSYDHTRDALTLVIQNFTASYTAVYTCTSDLTNMLDINPIALSLLITSSNPAVFIQSSVQYALAGNSTTIEATVYASPADSALIQWYHEGRLIDTLNETGYTASHDGDIHRLEIESVSESELGEYAIVVSLDGSNATHKITVELLVPPTSVSEGNGDAISTLEVQTESTTSHTYPSNSGTESDSHSPSPTITVPRIGAIVSGLFGGILLIFLVETIFYCVYKAYMRRVQKI